MSPATILATIGCSHSSPWVKAGTTITMLFKVASDRGFRWWEIDTTYYILRALSWLGLVWNLKTPPGHVLRNEHRLGVRIIHRAAEQLAARFNPERVASSIASALQGPELSSLQDVLRRAHNRATEVLVTMHLPHLPSRDQFLREARTMFSRTVSLEDIVDRAYQLLLVSVSSRLATSSE